MFNLTSKYYTYNRKNYTSGKYYCQVTVTSISDQSGLYILGDPFMRAFTTTFDYTDNKMEVGINPGAVEYVSVHTVMTNWEKFGIVAACLALLAIIITIAYFCYKKCKRDRYSLKERSGSDDSLSEVWKGKGQRVGGESLINNEDEITDEF